MPAFAPPSPTDLTESPVVSEDSWTPPKPGDFIAFEPPDPNDIETGIDPRHVALAGDIDKHPEQAPQERPRGIDEWLGEKLNLDKNTIPDALHTIGSFVAAYDPDTATPNENPEAKFSRLMELPSRPPTKGEQVAGGLINSLNRMTASMADPVNALLLVAGAVGPAIAARAVSAYFFKHMFDAGPEVWTRAGEISVMGDTQEKTEAYADAGMTMIFTLLAGAHAGKKGLANEVPALRDALRKRVETDYTAAEVRDLYQRVQSGKGTPEEQALVMELYQGSRAETNPLRVRKIGERGATTERFDTTIPEAGAVAKWLGLESTRETAIAQKTAAEVNLAEVAPATAKAVETPPVLETTGPGGVLVNPETGGISFAAPLTDQALKATEPTVQESLTVAPVVKESFTAEPPVAETPIPAVAPAGMGAAARGELPIPPDIPPAGQKPDTSIKNSSLDQARIDLSLEPIEKVARKGWEQIWDESGEMMQQKPELGELKTNEYFTNPRAFESEVDQAIVFRHEIAVRTAYTSVLMELNEAIVKGDTIRAGELRRSRDLLEQKLDVVDTVAKAGGSAAGGVLGARRMMVREDMSLGAITRREQIAADRPLTDIEHAEIAKLHAEMEAKDAAFDEALTAKEVEHADAAHKLALETLRAEAAEAKVPAISPYIIGIAERIGARLKADADVSRKALAGKFLSPTPKDLLHLANIMADNIYTMGLDFAKISAKMISELGPKVEPYLKDAFTKAQAIIEGNYAKVEPQARKAVKRTVEKTDANDAAEETASIIDAVKAKVEKRGDDVLEFIGGEARKLALKFVSEEVGKGRKPAEITGEEIDAAVHETLKEALPDITPVESRDAWTQYGKYSQLDKDAVKSRYREARTEQQKQSTLERLLGGEPGLKTGGERQPETNLSRRRQKQINELKKQLGIVTTDPATQLRSALQARETYYTNRLADLRSEIAKGERLIKTRNETPTSPALEALKAEYATVKAEHEAIFKKPGLTDAQKHALALKTAERNQSEWEIRLANAKKGNFETPPKGFVQRSAQLDAIRARTEAIREEVKLLKDLAHPKKTPDQIALQAFKTRTAKKMADQLDRMARSDFSKTPKRPLLDISKDAEAMKLAGEAAAIKTEFERRAEQHKAENFTTAENLAANFTSAIALSRNVMTAYDISAVGRQGGFIGAGNPIRAVRNLIPMFRAMASEKTAQAIHQSILHRPNAGLYVRDKLFLAELDGKLTAGEEATIGAIKLVQKIPGLRASNRAYSTYLNLLRADSYDAMMLKNEGRTGSMSVEDGRAIANFINVATGRGDLGRFESFAQPAASVLFSPRLNVSRVQMAIGQPMFGKTARTASPALRRMIAEEYAKTAIGVSAFIGLAVLAGATIETDPRSSDFAKLKFGNTRIDVGMGMQQYAVALARVYSGETKNLKTGKLKPTTPGDVAGSLLRTKSTPALGAAMDIWEIGHDKNPPPGHGQTYLQVVVNLWLPITSRNVVDIMEEHGVAAGTAFEILDLLGVSIQHFDTSKTLPKREKSP